MSRMMIDRVSQSRKMARWPLRVAALLGALVVALAGCGLPGTISSGGHIKDAGPAPTAQPLPPITLPQDEAPHRNLTEWWYYTGHFHGQDASGHQREYGIELTFFQTIRGQLPPFYAGHYAISDLTRGEFHYDQRTAFGSGAALPPVGSASGFNLSVQDWHIQGVGGADKLAATMPDYVVALTLSDQRKSVALHGGNGVITFGNAGYSYYYSRPLMSLSGTITDHGTPVNVTGQAWFDHQWGNFVSLAGAGWDWFSVQLNDKTQYMLYVIRDEQKKPISVVGTAVAPDGVASEIPADQIHITATGSWTSPHTQGVYPSGWKVSLPSRTLALTLAPALQDQELDTAESTGVAYWEGAVRIDGQQNGKPISGQGYVELTGYATIPSGAAGPTIP